VAADYKVVDVQPSQEEGPGTNVILTYDVTFQMVPEGTQDVVSVPQGPNVVSATAAAIQAKVDEVHGIFAL
jgi:hypothetical protein